MGDARYTIRIGSYDYIIQPGTFKEGSVRRQVETNELGEFRLKSRPDMREFFQTSWLGGAEWELPIYNPSNMDTYYDARNVTLTDIAGSILEGKSFEESTTSLALPETKLAAWNKNGTEGAVALWLDTTNYKWAEWVSGAWADAGATGIASLGVPFAAAGGAEDTVYALWSTGYLSYWDTSGSTHTSTDLSTTVYSGAAMWVDFDYVWVYNGDTITRYDINNSFAAEEMINDGDGPDIFSTHADFGSGVIIPKHNTPRAYRSSEGVFYCKNVFVGGQPVCKIYRVDKDASGAYINTPIKTLPAGVVGINIIEHLGSVIVSTLSNYHAAIYNQNHQRVTLYHVTGNSIGALGSPLGGEALDETPVWLMGTEDTQLYVGGFKRIWQYDARLGSIHPYRYIINTLSGAGGFTQMVPVKNGTSSGAMFLYSTDNALNPQYLLQSDKNHYNDNGVTSYLQSNWIDFGLPMEQKTITEFFWDSANIRIGSTVTVQVLADEGSWTTVQTISGTSSDNTDRVTLSTPITGYKFRYQLLFSDAVSTSSSKGGRIYSLGFSAIAGENVKVLQFTINGNECVNVENDVQIPYDVYTQMSSLRDTATAVTVRHWMASDFGSDYIEDTYKVVSVTTNKDSASEGMYDVVLMEV